MSTEKLSELSKPVAYDYQIAGACIADGHNENGKWVDWNNKLSRCCPPDWMMEEGKVTGLKLLYSQEYVSALTQRIAELSRLLAHNIERAESAEKRLDTPVRLPPPTAWMRGDDKTTFGPIFTKNKEYAESQWGDSATALYSVPVGIKEAAFSDERNLMHINERGRETSLIWSKNNSENGDIQLFRLVGFTVEGDE
ncbi:ead/Ea22-like family protein [Serratia nevei]|uniref:ead/Ea22-like family protein n=1 Tax=Serratia nevei TaxID=2703794 RepID=UPI003FA6F5ED